MEARQKYPQEFLVPENDWPQCGNFKTKWGFAPPIPPMMQPPILYAEKSFNDRMLSILPEVESYVRVLLEINTAIAKNELDQIKQPHHEPADRDLTGIFGASNSSNLNPTGNSTAAIPEPPLEPPESNEQFYYLNGVLYNRSYVQPSMANDASMEFDNASSSDEDSVVTMRYSGRPGSDDKRHDIADEYKPFEETMMPLYGICLLNPNFQGKGPLPVKAKQTPIYKAFKAKSKIPPPEGLKNGSPGFQVQYTQLMEHRLRNADAYGMTDQAKSEIKQQLERCNNTDTMPGNKNTNEASNNTEGQSNTNTISENMEQLEDDKSGSIQKRRQRRSRPRGVTTGTFGVYTPTTENSKNTKTNDRPKQNKKVATISH